MDGDGRTSDGPGVTGDRRRSLLPLHSAAADAAVQPGERSKQPTVFAALPLNTNQLVLITLLQED
jgi:hypothetical protein